MKSWEGHGPHLVSVSQRAGSMASWQTDDKSYVGSGDDGPADPHKYGYAEYDFDSIMHDSLSGRLALTTPRNALWLAGNRKHLSRHDIAEINDMYQCIKRENVTLPTSPLQI